MSSDTYKVLYRDNEPIPQALGNGAKLVEVHRQMASGPMCETVYVAEYDRVQPNAMTIGYAISTIAPFLRSREAGLDGTIYDALNVLMSEVMSFDHLKSRDSDELDAARGILSDAIEEWQNTEGQFAVEIDNELAFEMQMYMEQAQAQINDLKKIATGHIEREQESVEDIERSVEASKMLRQALATVRKAHTDAVARADALREERDALREAANSLRNALWAIAEPEHAQTAHYGNYLAENDLDAQETIADQYEAIARHALDAPRPVMRPWQELERAPVSDGGTVLFRARKVSQSDAPPPMGADPREGVGGKTTISSHFKPLPDGWETNMIADDVAVWLSGAIHHLSDRQLDKVAAFVNDTILNAS